MGTSRRRAGSGTIVLAMALGLVMGTVACQAGGGADDGLTAGSEPTWIGETGEPAERVIARQLRGLDVAMIEIDHRYAELYFAGQDGNWDYAGHQVEHMELAMDLALERRPARARSARASFYPALAEVEAAAVEEDAAAFGRAFERLRNACNTCHEAEDEPAFRVGVPTQRRTSIGAS